MVGLDYGGSVLINNTDASTYPLPILDDPIVIYQPTVWK